MTEAPPRPNIPTLSERLASRRVIYYIALIGVLLLLPTVLTGFKTDDLVQRYTMVGNSALAKIGFPLARAPAGVGEALKHYFTFFDPAIEGHNLAQRAYGTVPWWIDEEMKLSLFRPMTALTHWVDYQLWPDVPKNMHLHSLAWLAGWLLLAGVLYRRFIGPRAAAGLATLMFMLDFSYTLPATWIANRNALVCGVFGLLTLYLHDRWRTLRLWHWAVLAQLTLLLTLWSAEAGLGVTAYLFAYAVCLESGAWRERLKSLLPAAGIVVLWRLIYVLLGFGAARTDMYIDPGVNPLRFLSALVTRGPILLFSQMAALDEFTPAMAASLRFYVWIGLVVILALLGWVFYPLLRDDKRARFFMLGALISLIPLPAYAAVQGRLLIYVTFGMMGFLGLFITHAFRKRNTGPTAVAADLSSAVQGERVLVVSEADTATREAPSAAPADVASAAPADACSAQPDEKKDGAPANGFARFVAGLMVFLHVIASGFGKSLFFLVALGGFSGDILTTGTLTQEPMQMVFSQMGIDSQSAERQIILVNPPSPFLFAYLPYYMAWYNEIAPQDKKIVFPQAVRMLATGLTATELERVDEYTLKVRPHGGYLIPPEIRNPADPEGAPMIHIAHTLRLQGHDFRVPLLSPMPLGHIVDLPGVRIEVTRLTEDQRPAEATFRFEKSLDDPSLIWRFWSYGPEEFSMHPFDFKPLTLPVVGETLILRGPFG